jgi:hypothetical protein
MAAMRHHRGERRWICGALAGALWGVFPWTGSWPQGTLLHTGDTPRMRLEMSCLSQGEKEENDESRAVRDDTRD